MKTSRRTFLKGALAAGALAGAGQILPTGRLHAQEMAKKRGFFFIHLYGGVDTLFHLVPEALPTMVNREIDPLLISTTPSGVRYYDPAWNDMRDHMDDCVSIRNIACSTAHPSGDGEMYYGERGAVEMAAVETPWFNFASSEILATQYAVAPAVLSHIGRPSISGIARTFDINNRSPDPNAAAQRMLNIQNFAESLDALAGLPDASFQQKLFAKQKLADARTYSKETQRDFLARYQGAITQSDGLVENPTPIIWPPSETLKTQFSLTDEDIIAPYGRDAPIGQQLAFAYESARLRISNCFYLQPYTNLIYDSHTNNTERQLQASGIVMPRIAEFLTALKNTPSPHDASKTMFDDYSVVIYSEIGRANAPDPSGGGLSGGTPHWGWTSAACFGGGFKRGYSFGAISEVARGIPANFQTGNLQEGRVPTPGDLAATLLSATGLSPQNYGEPIEAVLA